LRTYPDLPWLTKAANAILETYLKPDDEGLEFGSGRSTIWFTKHVGRLTSVEHNKVWYDKVQAMIGDNQLTNVDYRFFPKDVEDERGADAAYVRVIDTFEPESFDFVLVDGVYRDHCCLSVLDKIRPGGVLIIDNVNWYLPC
jgi:predicted O-methyltransferase YrrM